MTKPCATVLAFAVAPILAALQLAALSAMSEMKNRSLTYADEGAFFAWFLIVFPYVFLFSTLLGGPLFLLVRHFGLVRWWTALISGALVGFLASVLVLSHPPTDWQDADFIPISAVSALGFWLVWRRGRESIASNSRSASSSMAR